MSKLFERLISVRGVSADFLNPQYDKLANAFDLPDMDKAVTRIVEAVKNGDHILIYGDYDVDGVTASTVMADTLKLAGVKAENIEIMLPDRFADGYGMSSKILKRAKKLVITVDCGSANAEIIQELNAKNIDVIVTDHHECSEILPPALAVVNPKRKDYNGFRDLAGVGVAFKVAQALVAKGKIKNGQEKWLLDLVLIGTICDNMPLIKENRILGFYGLKVLEKTRRAGLKELMLRAGIKKLDSESIGFQIGPRLNAAGRIESADISLKLLNATTRAEAAIYADKLEALNKKRKTEQQSAMTEICARGVNDAPVIVEVGNWHEGILGIIAGRLVEEFRRPAFVLSAVNDGSLKGSGRSFGEFNLAEALSNCSDFIINGGGHAGAAGVRVKAECVEGFCTKINDYYKSLKLTNQERFLKEHEDLCTNDLADFNLDLIDELKRLEPFGEGNNEPIFKLEKMQIMEVKKMGADGKHLSLMVSDGKKHLRLVAFFAPENWFNLQYGEERDILIHVIENEWSGTRSVEGRIVDIML